jgi:acyl-coenzyme A synthetase/AMP-(fatty) acid ligase
VDLVVDHVLQALVVGRPEEDLGVHLAARVAVVHDLQASKKLIVKTLRQVIAEAEAANVQKAIFSIRNLGKGDQIGRI